MKGAASVFLGYIQNAYELKSSEAKLELMSDSRRIKSYRRFNIMLHMNSLPFADLSSFSLFIASDLIKKISV